MPATANSPGLDFGDMRVVVAHRADGTTLVTPRASLSDYPQRLMDRLHHWAIHAPERVLIAERGADRQWRKVTYGQALPLVRGLASAFIERSLSPERPLVILSGNSVDHALMGFAALYAGVPYCPVSPPYSLMSKDFGKLRYAIELLTPGLVFAQDGDAFAQAVAATVPPDTGVAVSVGQMLDRPTTSFAEMAATKIHPDLDSRFAMVMPDTIAKFLLTSGSTGMPKCVINTQRMLCANQVMIRDTLAFLKQHPPVLLDWLPWNHTFGGNHNVGIVLFNGGSLYIDEGRPAVGGMAATITNLLEIAPTAFFNVPKGFEMLIPYLRADAALRKLFFSRLQVMFYAGASLSAHIWAALHELAISETGTPVPMLTGLGATETAPFSMSATPLTSRSGHVGLPVPGNEIKLVPNGGKLEVRVRGPNVTPGYWRDAVLTAKAFDEEGFYMLGDALKPVDLDNFAAGFDFDGRISEDFKLASATWVSVGPLRAGLILACAPLVRDVVLAGIDRDDITALIILDADGCREACTHLATDAPLAAIADDAQVRRLLRAGLQRLAAQSTGSSNRIARAIVIADHLQIDRGEITDKGSVNQRAVLEHRVDLVDALYLGRSDARILSPNDQEQM